MDTLLFILKSIILGIVEGVTEFLPVSSTGHLVIFENLLHFSANEHYVSMYTYVIQLGAILAVVILYWKKIKDTILNFFPQKVGYEKSGFRFWFMIFIACVPGAILGILFDDLAEAYLSRSITVAITLFLGAVWMLYAENRFRNNNLSKQKLYVTPKQALIIGSFQCLAIIPGMSRSASTIIGGWIAGLSTVAAAEFSFFLAVPTMFAATAKKLYDFYKGGHQISGQEINLLIVGNIIGFVVAMLAIKSFIGYLEKNGFKVFGWYRIIVGSIILAFLLAGFDLQII